MPGSRRYGSNPSRKLPADKRPDQAHAGGAVVEAREGGEALAAVLVKSLGAADRDLFQRLEAVGGKAGRYHRDPLDAVARDLRQGDVGIGLQPLGPAEARLKGESQPLGRPAELLAQETHRLLAVAVIRVALVESVAGQAVERSDDQIRLELEPGAI